MYFETLAGDNELFSMREHPHDKKSCDYEDESYFLALKFHEEFNQIPLDIEQNDLIRPDLTSNIHQLFNQFNMDYFGDQLSSTCIQWDQRIYGCGAVCLYPSEENSCRITLSEPLLRSRPRTDLIETLLHEMIHVYLYITKQIRDRRIHNEDFLYHMLRINDLSGMNIKVYHKFVDELCGHYWWQCNGICKNWRPFYGYFRRPVYRQPSYHDYWFSEHKRCCNGQLMSVKVVANEGKLQTITPPVYKYKLFVKTHDELTDIQCTADESESESSTSDECQFYQEEAQRENSTDSLEY
ncbi:unnamed protein product [Adineta ricciae]|uniref:SprT-like domain-containing protein n=1 Tax=Adineta ricciae TaxID=249248 RepID=A0A816D4H8_ADIRI|nr:unnamed protein product [Adineta ricciae]